MIRITFILCFALTFSTCIRAEGPLSKGLNSINIESAKAHIGFLACDELKGREAGTIEGRIAGRYIAANLQSLGIGPLNGSYLHPFIAAHAERQKKNARWQIHPDSIALLSKGTHQKLLLNNVLGVIQGKRADEYVIVGAHYDHIGYDPALAGDAIYNGADDNASGVSAVLQIARAFMVSGIQPERTVIFAFWDGEEKGLLGSRAFVQSFKSIKQVKGYLNFDMIGRNHDENNPQHVVYFYTESHPVFGDWLKEDIEKYRLNLKPDYRAWDKPIGGSDNSSFARLDIPIIWYHTDGHPDYHQPGDHAEKINWDKVLDITKASFLNMWNLANEYNY
ncbi:MAG TPA: aminopeptidase [Parabacteroides sp.]|nr:aminopeptidase [Parabacteroides sp.]